MMDELRAIGPQALPPEGGRPGPSTSAEKAGKSFKELVLENLNQVNRLMKEKDGAVEKLASGESDNLSEVMTAIQKADLAFKTLMQIRNKLVEAYEELNRLRI